MPTTALWRWQGTMCATSMAVAYAWNVLACSLKCRCALESIQHRVDSPSFSAQLWPSFGVQCMFVVGECHQIPMLISEKSYVVMHRANEAISGAKSSHGRGQHLGKHPCTNGSVRKLLPPVLIRLCALPLPNNHKDTCGSNLGRLFLLARSFVRDVRRN